MERTCSVALSELFGVSTQTRGYASLAPGYLISAPTALSNRAALDNRPKLSNGHHPQDAIVVACRLAGLPRPSTPPLDSLNRSRDHWKCDRTDMLCRSFRAISGFHTKPGATLRSPLATLFRHLRRYRTERLGQPSGALEPSGFGQPTEAIEPAPSALCDRRRL
jgi:hypothetical protein